ncbi:MucB/RseB C-terminal domain-containing protein [Rhodoferax sp.]|uniref:MucB/RseB C-terminal domain-containing protein n=1 Tax=Rhodoferax sp. TaxID=50421 RepID=UPI002764535B|nr:MucB/RseB C-terminal domain-containing protein [Rhodoferax sp.]
MAWGRIGVFARRTRRVGLAAVIAVCLISTAGAQTGGLPGAATATGTEAGLDQRSVRAWLVRMHEASRRRAYIGTVVVSDGVNMASARIWHVCDGTQQIERVVTLTGAPRTTFRRNDQVVTFLPQSMVVVTERRESLGLFPNLLQTGEATLGQFYQVRQSGHERVAGLEADVIVIAPRDRLRFGYRIWSEQGSGLALKLQTLNVDGQVLEQVAFSELQLDAPVSLQKLARMMGSTEGYRIERVESSPTTALSEGWTIANPVPGFQSVSCHKRPVAPLNGSAPETAMQWVFSDGLGTVSLFVQPFDPRRQPVEGATALGATHTLTRRNGAWWVTAVGEAPLQTLEAFVQGLERKR